MDISSAGVSSSWNRATMGEGPAKASSSWSWTTADHPTGVSSWGDRTTAVKHSGHGSSGSHTSKSGGSAGAGSLGDQTAVNRASGRGISSSGKEGYSVVNSSQAGAGSESLTLPTVELERALRAWLPPTVNEPFPPEIGCPLTSLVPRVLRLVLGIHLLWELKSLQMPIQLEPVHRRTSLPQTDLMASRGDGSFRSRSEAVCSHSYGKWRSWHNWLFSEPDARYGWSQWHGSSRHGASGLHDNSHLRRYRVTVHSAHCPVAATRTPAYYLELSPWREFRPSHETTSSAYGVSWWRKYGSAPVSVLIMVVLHNPSSMAVPPTGMDMQYGPSDLAVQMGTSNMQQQAQYICWIQPPQFGALDQQMLFPRPQFVQQPTASHAPNPSRPRMHQPCGGWMLFYNKSSIWFIPATDLECLGHLFTRMQVHL